MPPHRLAVRKLESSLASLGRAVAFVANWCVYCTDLPAAPSPARLVHIQRIEPLNFRQMTRVGIPVDDNRVRIDMQRGHTKI